MKEYRVLSRDAEYSKAWPKISKWFDWEKTWDNKEEAQAEIDKNKELDVASAYDPDQTEYKIQERKVSEWRDSD